MVDEGPETGLPLPCNSVKAIDVNMKFAKQMALDMCLDTVEFVTVWNGFRVYNGVLLDDSEDLMLGEPFYFLESDTGCRLTTREEYDEIKWQDPDWVAHIKHMEELDREYGDDTSP